MWRLHPAALDPQETAERLDEWASSMPIRATSRSPYRCPAGWRGWIRTPNCADYPTSPTNCGRTVAIRSRRGRRVAEREVAVY
jgi:hypothetical protein